MITPHIKQIIEGYMNYIDLSDLVVGKVISVNPISIQVEDLPKPLGTNNVVVPKHLVEPVQNVVATIKGGNSVSISGLSITHSLKDEGTVGHGGSNPAATLTFNGPIEMVIDTKDTWVLKPGDLVYMVMAKGGQKYLVLCKAVET